MPGQFGNALIKDQWLFILYKKCHARLKIQHIGGHFSHVGHRDVGWVAHNQIVLARKGFIQHIDLMIVYPGMIERCVFPGQLQCRFAQVEGGYPGFWKKFSQCNGNAARTGTDVEYF